jgi:hypothetical protein
MVDLGPILNHRVDLARKILWIKRGSPKNGFSCRPHKSGPDLVYANQAQIRIKSLPAAWLHGIFLQSRISLRTVGARLQGAVPGRMGKGRAANRDRCPECSQS